MTTFYPSLETIAKFKVPPTEGEQKSLDFLRKDWNIDDFM